MRGGVRRRAAAARADRTSRRRCGRTARCSARTCWSRPGRSCSGSPPRSCSASALAVAMHLVPVGRARAAAAGRRLAGGADPGDRAADRARARLRARAEDPDRRAGLLLPGRRSTSPTGCATSTPTRASCCARWTRRAGSGCACSRRRPRCPPRSPGMKIAAAVAVIGAVFAEWAGSDAGLGHLAAHRQRAARDARARSPPPCCCSPMADRALRRSSRCSSGGSSTWAPRSRSMRRSLAARRAALVARSPAAARRPSRPATAPARARSRSR